MKKEIREFKSGYKEGMKFGDKPFLVQFAYFFKEVLSKPPLWLRGFNEALDDAEKKRFVEKRREIKRQTKYLSDIKQKAKKELKV